MANKILWDAAAASQGTILSTQLNAVADSAFTATGSEYDNSTNLFQYFMARFAATFSAEPTAGGYITLYAVKALDGSTYETVESADPMADHAVAIISTVPTTAQQVRDSNTFTLPPSKVKFSVKNSTGQTLPASNSVITLFSFSDEVQ